MSTREPMTGVDAAWLRMDDDTQRMMITVLLRFDGKLSFGDVESLVRERVLRSPRFRQRVVESSIPGIGPAWEDDPNFSLASHLHRIALPFPHDDDALTALASDLASTSLDRRMPLWQIHVVEGAENGTALIARLHHAIGDGVSLVAFLLTLTDECESTTPQQVGLALGPMPESWRKRAEIVIDHSLALARLTTLRADPLTLFRGDLGREKRVSFSRRIAIASLKHAAAEANAKLNDVLLAITTGAARRYMQERSETVDELELRALVPVFFRGGAGTDALGNHFGLVFAPLLIGIADPYERIREVKRRMDALKSAPDALVGLEVLEILGHAGRAAEQIGIDLFTRKASFMITNIPGPRGELHVQGRVLQDLVVWAPTAGHIGVGVSLLSYGANVRIGIVADSRRMPDPTRFVRAIEGEAASLGA